jgi:hypothetical protein
MAASAAVLLAAGLVTDAAKPVPVLSTASNA